MKPKKMILGVFHPALGGQVGSFLLAYWPLGVFVKECEATKDPNPKPPNPVRFRKSPELHSGQLT